MTDLIARPPRPRSGGSLAGTRSGQRPPAPVPPVSWAGVLAALRAAGLGLLTVMVLVLVAWATAADSAASAPEAVRGGLAIWLVGHLARLGVPGGTFGLAPLGLTVLPGLLLFSSAARGARSAQVRGRRGVVALTAALAASYAAIAVVVSLCARTAAIQPRPVTAFVGAAVLAGVAGGAGAVHGSGRTRAWWARLPVGVRVAAPGAAGALTVVLVGGAVLVGAMLARHHGDATGLFASLDGGLSGTLLVLLVCLAYAPTAVVWGAAYLVGPGFAVGTGTSVAAGGVTLGQVPAVPLLAALPRTEQPAHGLLLVTLVAAAAGVVAGLLVDRAARREVADPVGSWRALLQVSALTGGLAGAGAGLLAGGSAGPAGPGRLAHTGPTWWWVALLAAAEVAVAVAAVLAARRGARLHRQASR